MKITIYRVVADQGPYISAWRTSRKVCKDLIEFLKTDWEASHFFGTNYHIEMADLQIDN